MQNLHETPRQVAERIRQLATGVNNPDDIATIQQFADEVEAVGKSEQENWIIRTHRG